MNRETACEEKGILSEENSQSQLEKSGSVTVTRNGHTIHCLTVIGQIEGHDVLPPQNKTTKYEHVIPQLVAVEQSESVEGLLVILNTVGGDIEAGLAIAELLSGMKKPTVSLVLGGGHSIGIPLAVAAKRSFIASTATMTVHPVRTTGTVIGVAQTMAYFNRIQERIISFVSGNSSIKADDFRRLMLATGGELVTDVGTILDGGEAVHCGLIDRQGSLSEALRELEKMIEDVNRRN